MRALERQAGSEFVRRAVDQAIKTEDFGPIYKLGKGKPGLWPDIAQQLFASTVGRQRKQGRSKGDPRPTDRDPMLLDLLQAARDDLDVIKLIWKKHFGKVNRGRDSSAPHARDIAAAYRGVDRDELENYLKEKRGH
jgi:hypothetical protein